LIYVKLTNGFGNNLFQYNAAKILALYHKTEVIAIPPFKDYYGISALQSLGVNFLQFGKSIPTGHRITDSNYVSAFKEEYKNKIIILSGYFEDYRYYINLREKIRSWYPETPINNNKDLVVHFRAGDRLFYKNEFYLKPRPQNFINAISKFDFEKLYIVTDMPCWERISEKDLEFMKFHHSVPKEQSVSIQESVEFFNSFVDGFADFDPIIQNQTLIEDFNFIRGFKNILFEHGTLSWWAAFLGNPDKVGVYGPWRAWKGKSNKNLSQITLDNWFTWK
jgi:hypothetical protein